MKATSCWVRNRISARLKMEMIRRKASFTSLPLYFDDVKKESFISNITEGFDEGDDYETVDREYKRRAEIIVSCNYFGCEETRTSDGERMTDRIASIPFQEWGHMEPAEFSGKQRAFNNVMSNNEKPTEVVIGDFGNFICSEEFLEKREAMADLLFKETDGVVKIRTLVTNYASFYACFKKLYSDYEDVMREVGCTWEGFLDWVREVHAPFIVKQHQEKDHSRNNIKRYMNNFF